MEVVLIAHDIRSLHNVGSLARSADGFGIKTIYCTGITPYVSNSQDPRPPHIRKKIIKAINKTALGAETMVSITHHENITELISKLRHDGYSVFALEQSKDSKPLNNFPNKVRIAVILGTEVNGLPESILKLCHGILEIPMLGSKESLNVSVAGAIAMYELKHSEIYLSNNGKTATDHYS